MRLYCSQKDLDFALNIVNKAISPNNTLPVLNNILLKVEGKKIYFSSTNTSRPVLSGVYFSITGKKLVIVATDSYRLAEKTLQLDKDAKEDISCIIPAKTLLELLKITAKSEEKIIDINISKNQVLFKIGGVDLISRLIEGKFPDYKKIIPRENKTRIEVSVEDLSIVLKRVNLFAKENNNSVKLTVTNDGKLMVTSEETKIGEEKAEVLVKVEGENNKISLNSQYLLDVLTYTNNDKVALYINDKGAPAVAKPLKDEGYVYIIMPLKV